eukprot:6120993-Amphidinium_carterae.1
MPVSHCLEKSSTERDVAHEVWHELLECVPKQDHSCTVELRSGASQFHCVVSLALPPAVDGVYVDVAEDCLVLPYLICVMASADGQSFFRGD